MTCWFFLKGFMVAFGTDFIAQKEPKLLTNG